MLYLFLLLTTAAIANGIVPEAVMEIDSPRNADQCFYAFSMTSSNCMTEIG
jgi:hypothetical protein